MSDWCKKCEIYMFGETFSNAKDDEIVLCEGCGTMVEYGTSKKLHKEVCDNGMEDCKICTHNDECVHLRRTNG